MLSILIPAYNFDISELVSELTKQCQQENIKYEIRVVDDGSDFSFQKRYRDIDNYPEVIITTQSNQGRSATRNRLIQEATYDILLFIDADCMPASEHYIKSYKFQLSGLQEGQIICGGVSYQEKPSERDLLLHWQYGSQRESLPAKERSKTPYRYFFTSNLLLHKSVFRDYDFPDQIDGYGYEDIAIGYQFEKLGFRITHVDNPVIHNGLKRRRQYLKDIREGSTQLAKLYDAGSLRTKLTDKYESMKDSFLIQITMGLRQILKPLLIQVNQYFPSQLWTIDALKLIYFSESLKRNK